LSLKRNGRAQFINAISIQGGSFSNATGSYLNATLRNRVVGGLSAIFMAYSNGTLAPSAFLLPQKPGSMASYTEVRMVLTPTASLTPGLPMVASSSMVLTLVNATADKVISIVASDTLALTVTTADLTSAVQAEASSSGTLTPSATLGGIFEVEATANLVGAPTFVLTALGGMVATAGGPTELSPEGLSVELLDNQNIETGVSLRETMRLVLSALAGKLSGAPGTTITIRNVTDDKDRIVATVDSSGNRSSIIYDTAD